MSTRDPQDTPSDYFSDSLDWWFNLDRYLSAEMAKRALGASHQDYDHWDMEASEAASELHNIALYFADQRVEARLDEIALQRLGTPLGRCAGGQ